MRLIDRAEVRERLTYALCIPIVREAMIAFSAGETRQLLRSIIPLAEGRLFGIMPGALAADGPFGAKLISVFAGNAALGRQSHQGVVVIFDPETGEPVCIALAGEDIQRCLNIGKARHLGAQADFSLGQFVVHRHPYQHVLHHTGRIGQHVVQIIRRG